MALGAVLGAALNTGATRSKGLFVGGTDVIIDAVAPVEFAVPLQTVRIDHKGPGGVSTMSFRIECYTVPASVSVADGMDVRFVDFTNTRTLFAGWVDHVDIVNLTGNRGTVYVVQCIGIESILDWSILSTDLTFATGTLPETAVQAIFANCTGTSLGRLNTASGAGAANSTDAAPIESFGGAVFTQNPLTITAGTTMREAIRQIGAQVNLTDPSAYFVTTIDFNGGLRWFRTSSGSTDVTGWDFVTINNDTPGTGNGEDTTYGIDAAQYRGVIVKGTGVTVFAGAGGKEGPIAVLNDAAITTIAQATAAGNAYLAPYGTQARGSYELTDKAPATGSIPGGRVTITDQRLGLSASPFVVGSVARSWNNSQRENWKVSFGAQAPSSAGLMRQLTRTTLS